MSHADAARKRLQAHIETVAAKPVRKKTVIKKFGAKPAVKPTAKPGAVKPISKIDNGKVKRAAKPAAKTLTKEQIVKWKGLSPKRQAQYLKQHPDSVYKKLGVSKEPEKGKDAKGAKGKGKNILGMTVKPRSAQELARSKRRVGQLKADGAMNKGSKQREESAAVVERDAGKIIKETLPDDQRARIADEIRGVRKQAKKNPNPQPAKNRKDGVPPGAPQSPNVQTPADEAPKEIPVSTIDETKDDEDLYKESDTRDEPGKKRSGWKTLAYMAGAVGVAALIGGAVFAVNPAMAMYLGYHFLDKMPDMMDAVLNRVESDVMVLAEDDDDIDQMLGLLAEYIRAGDLPEDIVAKLEAELNEAAE